MLLFSYSTRMLDLIGAMLTRAGYTFQRLDGATRQADRQKLVDTFNTSPSSFLFLISTGAGSLGLNLTGANKCALGDQPQTQIQNLDHITVLHRRVQPVRELNANKCARVRWCNSKCCEGLLSEHFGGQASCCVRTKCWCVLQGVLTCAVLRLQGGHNCERPAQ